MNAPVSSFQPGALFETAAARVSLMPPQGRLSLRARGELSALETALGLRLPGRIGARATAGGLEAIRLGPDEWFLLVPEAAPVLSACQAIRDSHPHSLVDVSGREVSLAIEGPKAAELLTLGVPRDIASIPVGEGRRTICDGVTIVLWRDAPTRFRIDIWHSFAPFLLHLLETGSRELAAEI